jgi:3-oxoacyl-[acyl-carrier protein] reductase
MPKKADPESRREKHRHAFADLSGRPAIVTGASSGIGRAVALELARAGADILVHGRSEKGCAETAKAVRALGREAAIVRADLSEPDACATFADEAFEAFPDAALCVLNAGADILTTGDRNADYATRLQRLLDIDVRATMLLGRTIGERLKRLEASDAALLTIGWDQSDRGMEGESGELFAAAKNAVMGFSRSLAMTLAPAVRVNCIAPGWIRTAWGKSASKTWQDRVRRETPLERWGTPEDVARMARFLLSPDAAYITGQVINVNGGAVR